METITVSLQTEDWEIIEELDIDLEIEVDSADLMGVVESALKDYAEALAPDPRSDRTESLRSSIQDIPYWDNLLAKSPHRDNVPADYKPTLRERLVDWLRSKVCDTHCPCCGEEIY